MIWDVVDRRVELRGLFVGVEVKEELSNAGVFWRNETTTVGLAVLEDSEDMLEFLSEV